MCRLVGYLGAPVPLGKVVAAPPHSLLRQSWQAREMASATVNADGWGAGIYLDDDPLPCVYASTSPIWADANLPHLGRALRSHAILAQVRSATDPLSVARVNTQPFASDRYLFLHNGRVDHFRERVRRRLCSALSEKRHAGIAGTTDSEHLFALILDEIDRAQERSPEAVLAAAATAVRKLAGWAVEAGVPAHVALVLSDGETLVALRHSTEGEPPSLYLLPEAGAVAPGILLASERLDDDPRWRAIPAGAGVVVTRAGGAAIRELP